ncbi:hypothetical protein [Massilia niabensis]|uniref:Uncharacterized protein n=1 Tax=Massilia niabensis TaxID=544910 RepID=A0ABW0L4N0_9BURK
MMRTQKNIAILISIALLAGSGNLPYAQTALESCSAEAQKSFYRDLFVKDQKLRGPIAAAEFNVAGQDRQMELRHRLLAQDVENQAQLDTIVAACGWPQDGPFIGSNLEVAFLVIQHSSREFTETYRSRVEAAFAKGLIPERQMNDFRRYVALKNRWSE